jgi:hypothetical protein
VLLNDGAFALLLKGFVGEELMEEVVLRDTASLEAGEATLTVTAPVMQMNRQTGRVFF